MSIWFYIFLLELLLRSTITIVACRKSELQAEIMSDVLNVRPCIHSRLWISRLPVVAVTLLRASGSVRAFLETHMRRRRISVKSAVARTRLPLHDLLGGVVSHTRCFCIVDALHGSARFCDVEASPVSELLRFLHLAVLHCFGQFDDTPGQMQWSNYDNFVNLCESTQVDGSHGRVYYLDMIRNPGSTREGTALAEKTVAGLYQNCYASSCEIPIIQQMATRNWYKNDPYLDLGSVTVRKLDQPFGEAAAVTAGGLLWWPWLIVAACVALCVLCLVRWFRMPKRTPSMRKSNRWEEEDDISLKGDMAEMQPLKQQAMPPPMAPMPPMPMRAGDGSWVMSDKPRIVRDVQDLPTLPTDVDIQMPDMQQFAGSSLPRHQRVISQTRGPAIPAVPQVVPVPSPVPVQQYSLPLQSNNRAAVQLPNVYSGSPTAGTSLQGYQGSIGMPGAQVASGAQVMSVAPVPAGDGSLLALSQQMASQIETSGAEAIRSLRHGQYPAVSVASGSQQPSYIPMQTPLSTPLYQPVAQVPPYQYR